MIGCDGKGTIIYSRPIYDEDDEIIDIEEDFEPCDGCEACQGPDY